MADIRQTWSVEPHGELVSLAEGLLTVEGEIEMPLGRFPRRMTVARLSTGGTVIWSAVALREPDMERVEALGAPAWLVVPGVAHRLDARIWKARYPAMKVLCPPGAREKVEEAVAVDATEDPFGDPAMAFEVVPGTRGREAALHVRSPRDEVTLVTNDIVANVRHPHGAGAHIMARLLGFGVNHPSIPWVGKRIFLDDPRALAAAMRRWADEPGLRRLVPSHGDVLEAPSEHLRRLADDLDGRGVAAA